MNEQLKYKCFVLKLYSMTEISLFCIQNELNFQEMRWTAGVSAAQLINQIQTILRLLNDRD